MNRIPLDEDDAPADEGPELVPPAELLRLRTLLLRGPRAATRARHLAATTAEARQRPLVAGTAGRFATWGGRVAVGIVASLAITSGLAGAQLLPQPAQRLLSGVSDRFAPPAEAPATTVADAADPVVADAGGSSGSADRRSRTVADGTGTGTEATDPAVTTVPPTTDPPVVETIPGPTGPGSPGDPTTDPDEPEPTTSTTEPEPSTTTTTPPSTTTTTTPPSTTTTTSSSP